MKNSLEAIIIDELMTDIHNGRYDINEKLPSENQLADQFHASRMTIRKVYTRLQEMGYVYPKQGKGWYLKNRQKHIELVLSGKESFSRKMKNKGYSLISQNICCVKIQYDSKIYQELDIRREDEVYKIGRLRMIDNRPIALHHSYVAKSRFPDIEAAGSRIVSMFDYYKSQGYKEFKSDKSILSIVFPTLKEREVLCCPELIPLLVIETNCIDAEKNGILEYSKIYYVGDSFKYVVEG